jgi:hypothetical protein
MSKQSFDFWIFFVFFVFSLRDVEKSLRFVKNRFFLYLRTTQHSTAPHRTAHRTPHTTHRTQHTAHRTPHTAHHTPYTAHRTPHTAHRTLHHTPPPKNKQKNKKRYINATHTRPHQHQRKPEKNQQKNVVHRIVFLFFKP